jgi:hypothetical protein
VTGRGRHVGIAWLRAGERDRSARNVHQSRRRTDAPAEAAANVGAELSCRPAELSTRKRRTSRGGARRSRLAELSDGGARYDRSATSGRRRRRRRGGSKRSSPTVGLVAAREERAEDLVGTCLFLGERCRKLRHRPDHRRRRRRDVSLNYRLSLHPRKEERHGRSAESHHRMVVRPGRVSWRESEQTFNWRFTAADARRVFRYRPGTTPGPKD